MSRSEAADRIHSAAIHLLRRVAREDPASGVSPARLSALSVLVYGGPKTVTELAASERVRPPTMSRLVASMEQEGLLRRAPHETDGRSVRLEVTGNGRAALERGREARLSLLEGLLASADEREIAVVAEAAAIVERLLRSG